MKKLNQIIIAIFCCCMSTLSFSQHVCSAAFLGNKMIVDKYTDKGYKNQLPISASGLLTVNTVDLSPTASKAIDKIPFKVAIKDKATQTLTMFASENFLQVDVKKVLEKCKKGDKIVLMTTEKQYALPHNEILVQ